MSTGSVQSDSGSGASTDRAEKVVARPAAPLAGLMETIVEATEEGRRETPDRAEARDRLDEFLAEPSPQKALLQWLTLRGLPAGKHEIAQVLSGDIARLDQLITRQVNAILHHPRFQKLEASWRGLQYLVDQGENAEGIKVRVLNVSWKELVRDVDQALEFDQSHLFHKVYSEEFGMPGGEPFGVLLGDYEIWPAPCAEHPIDDVEALTKISGVAAAAFAPFIAGVHPAMFGVDDFSALGQPLNLSAAFEQLEYVKWRGFRENDDSRFVGLTLPRVLMRLPYEDDGSRTDGFVYREDVAGPDRSKYLWGNAAYAFGAVLIRAYRDSGWLADIRGVRRDEVGGGLVTGLPVHSFSTDREGVATKCSTDMIISDFQEQGLSELGFIPLCHCADTEFSAFFATQSVQEPKKYDELEATMNARISAMLQYTLCVSLFAHYLKVVFRDSIGEFSSAGELQDQLQQWLAQYVCLDSQASREVKAELPLREAKVKIDPIPWRPGSYMCVARLWPHYDLDDLASTLTVKTELTAARPM